MAKNETLNSQIDTSKKQKIRKSRGLAFLLSATVFFFILTSSIAAPILVRDFYYSQIEGLELVKDTGLSEEEIKTAYDEMLDFCIGARSDFAVGKLSYSEEGKEHFVDCRGLFLLDLGVLAVTTVMLVVWVLIRRSVYMRATRPKGLGPAFWGSASLLGAFAVIGTLGAIDFETTFVIFHRLFFPGKSNWLFDPRIDQVITILPETFFMRCAILIVGLILTQCLILIVAELLVKRHNEKNKHKRRSKKSR